MKPRELLDILSVTERLKDAVRHCYTVIRQIKRCLFRQIKTGLLWCLIMV